MLNIKLIQARLFDIADYIHLKVEQVKISVKTSGAEKEINKDIALLGKRIFETREKNLSCLANDKTVLEREARIINDQNQLLKTKKEYMKRSGKRLRIDAQEPVL